MVSDRDANGTDRRINSKCTFQLCDRGRTPLGRGEDGGKNDELNFFNTQKTEITHAKKVLIATIQATHRMNKTT